MKDSIIIGYSGVHHARDLKREFFPAADERELCISQGADSAAAILVNGQVIGAAAEERFTGIKHTGAFPVNALSWCLREAGVRVDQVDVIAHAFDFAPVAQWAQQEEYHKRVYDSALSGQAQRKFLAHFLGASAASLYRPVKHHLSHAAYAMYSSGFPSAAIFVSDGLGEDESASLYRGTSSKLEKLGHVSSQHSVGMLYGLITHYLGFWLGSDEYKVMGLAPYGDASRYRDKFRNYVRLFDGGLYSVPLLSLNKTLEEREFYSASLLMLERDLGPRRMPDAPLTQQHMDIAAALQESFEGCLDHSLRHLRRISAETSLCMAGGCALNCSANGRVLASKMFDRIYIAPAAGDDGAALGAALYAQGGLPRPERASIPLLGPAITDAEIEAALPDANVETFRLPVEKELIQRVAALLAKGKIVAWVQGHMEFGPRALGARSILADPRASMMREKINALVKKREQFRPFAPAVTMENAPQFFDISPADVSAFESMLFTASVHPDVRALLPAITHVDGSARVQCVDEAAQPLFWKLLKAFELEAGIPVLLNTSFNVAGQPIVRTAMEAIKTFFDARLDALCIGNYLLVRKE